jgi:hypothetical protein
MTDEMISTHLQRQMELETQRSNYEPKWKLVSRVIYPRRSVWVLDTEGLSGGEQMYSQKAFLAAVTMADGILGNSLSTSYPWLKMGMKNREDSKLYGVLDWLDLVTETISDALDSCGFYNCQSEFIKDGVTLCTASCYAEELFGGDSPFTFLSLHPREIFLIEDFNGKVWGWHRKYKKTREQCMQTFKDCPKEWGESEASKKQKVEILHVVVPRSNTKSLIEVTENKPYLSVYIDIGRKTVLRESGYDMANFFTWRYSKDSGEVYGRGPGVDIVESALHLTQLGKASLQLVQMAADPPMNVPEEMRNQERLVPRGLNYFTDPQKVMSPVRTNYQYPVTRDFIDAVEQQVDEAFYVPMFKTLAMAERQMTAFEVAERVGEKATLLTPMLGRYYHDLVRPTVIWMFERMMARGLLPEPPRALARMKGKIEIKMIGPLPQAQKRFYELSGVQKALGLAQGVAQYDPSALDWIDFNELIKTGLNGASVPERVIREGEDVTKIRQMKAQQAAAANQQAMTVEAMKNANKLSQPVKEGSILEKLGV